jgi:digeranylgeranylglycerophospholipid reductase
MKHYDLAVIGGSFSGLACAKSAAASGLKTIVFERKQSPGAYTQSTGIFVKEIAETLNLPQHLTKKISGIRLYGPNMQSIDLCSEHYYFLATDTGGVLDWMARQLKIAGGHIRCGSNVDNIINQDKRTIIPKENISCSYLVGADGAKSKTAQYLQLGRNRQFLLGAEYEVEGLENLDPDFLHVFLDSTYASGYIGWVLHGVNHTQIGTAVNYPQRPDVKGFLLHLLQYFGGSATVINRRGGAIPCGGIVQPFAMGNACLLGDAAGMVSPLTAGGIHPAIELGEQLGKAISDYLLFGGDKPEQCLENIMPNYHFKQPLRWLYSHCPPPNWLLNACIGNPLFQRIAQVTFFHHRGLFCKAAWKEILLHTH